MATAIQYIRAVKLAYVNEQYPSTHYTLDSNTWYYVGDSVFDKIMLIKFEQFPTALRHNILLGFRLRLQIDASRNTSLFSFSACERDFDANTLTYYTRPQLADGIVSRSFQESVYGDAYIPAELTGTIYEQVQK